MPIVVQRDRVEQAKPRRLIPPWSGAIGAQADRVSETLESGIM
jgi:hypothetical protein